MFPPLTSFPSRLGELASSRPATHPHSCAKKGQAEKQRLPDAAERCTTSILMESKWWTLKKNLTASHQVNIYYLLTYYLLIDYLFINHVLHITTFLSTILYY